jgi:hypothetical protein
VGHPLFIPAQAYSYELSAHGRSASFLIISVICSHPPIVDRECVILTVEDIDWEKLGQSILEAHVRKDKYGNICKEICLGKTCDLTPSGEHRDFGRSARTDQSPSAWNGWTKAPDLTPSSPYARPPNEAEIRDNNWWQALREKAEQHKIYIRPMDKDRTYIVAGIVLSRGR